jgi:hypothetical protein
MRSLSIPIAIGRMGFFCFTRRVGVRVGNIGG